MKAKGKCFCGKIQFELETLPNTMTYCHCSMCRKAHGAPYVLWLAGKDHSYHFSSGKELVKVYRSSAEAKRSFCSNCGTPMFFESARWPKEIDVAAVLLEEIDQKPQKHIFYDDRMEGIELNDGLPKLGGATGLLPR